MDRQRVQSSNLAAIGYDEASEVLEVEFLSGSVYQYANVPPDLYRRLTAANSHGQFFNTHIKNRGYRTTQIC